MLDPPIPFGPTVGGPGTYINMYGTGVWSDMTDDIERGYDVLMRLITSPIAQELWGVYEEYGAPMVKDMVSEYIGEEATEIIESTAKAVGKSAISSYRKKKESNAGGSPPPKKVTPIKIDMEVLPMEPFVGRGGVVKKSAKSKRRKDPRLSDLVAGL